MVFDLSSWCSSANMFLLVFDCACFLSVFSDLTAYTLKKEISFLLAFILDKDLSFNFSEC